jgi:DNA-binding GntR family transcriptional regulator
MGTEQTSEQRQPSLAEQAYHALENGLVELVLAPGTIVSESRLIEVAGFGRTPVREAMQRLAHHGLIRVLPRKGLQITPVLRADILHVLEVRKPLERLIVYRASLNARDEQRSAFSAIARALTISHDDFGHFRRLSRELDDLLDTCAGNEFAISAVAPLRIHCRRFWYYYRHRLQLSEAIIAHSTMIRLIARRDFNGARKASDAVSSVLERLAASVEQ